MCVNINRTFTTGMGLDDSSGFVYDGTILSQNEPPVITIITVRAFKQRLTVAERHALRTTTDLYAADIYDDLLTSSYVDLELDDVAQGIGYILNLLTSVPSIQDANVMTVLGC